MKLVMDEKLKHRLIGLAVIISLGAIFAPAIMKKSSQHLDGNLNVNVQLPAKPLAPNVVMTDEKDVFKTIKVAKVDIPPVSDKKQLSELVKAKPISTDPLTADKAKVVSNAVSAVKVAPIQLALKEVTRTAVKKTIQVASAKPKKTAPVFAKKQKPVIKLAKVNNKIVKAGSRPIVKQDIYAVQLASFIQLNNAQSLVSRLRSKGYKANYNKVSGRNGPVYKVYVGHSPRKIEVIKLRTQLASAMQLNGFVVNTGVS